jgi:hypothetical protein
VGVGRDRETRIEPDKFQKPLVAVRARWRRGDTASLWPLWKCFLGPGVTVIVAAIMAPVYVSSMRPPADRIVDFYQEWASARNYLEGLPVYADHRESIPRYLSLRTLRPQHLLVKVNAHPPTSVLLALPVALLHYPDAVFVWNLTSLGMLGISLFAIWRGFGIPFSLWWLFPLITSLLICSPLITEIICGQLNLVILLLLTGTWAADRSGRPLLAGVALGTATTIKLFPGFLFFYFIFRGQWRSLLAGMITVALLTGLTATVLGLEVYRTYIDDVLPRVSEFRGGWRNASLTGFWIKLFDPPANEIRVQPLWRSAAIARLGTIATCAPILMALAWIVRRAATRTEQDLAFGLALTAMLLVSPIVWDHYLLLLPIPITAIWRGLPRSCAARMLFAAILGAFWSSPALVQNLMIPGGFARGIADPLHTVTLLSYQCYALVALFGLGVVEAVRYGRCATSASSGTDSGGGASAAAPTRSANILC